jgi:uncharacterized protein YggT (Ycf19 family)
MLTLILVTKLVCEIALLSLLGRAALALLLGTHADGNPFYGLLCLASQPFVKAMRYMTPKFIPIDHHPWVAFCLLAALWLGVTLAKIKWCLSLGVARCQS